MSKITKRFHKALLQLISLATIGNEYCNKKWLANAVNNILYRLVNNTMSLGIVGAVRDGISDKLSGSTASARDN